MVDRVLYLDIRSTRTSGVVLSRSGKVVTVTAAAAVDSTDMEPAEALRVVKEETGFRGDVCRLNFGTEFFSYRNITLPFADKKKIAQVITNELVEWIPGDVEDMAVDFLIAGGDKNHSDICAVLFAQQMMIPYQAAAQEVGLRPRAMGISGLGAVHRLAQGEKDSFIFLDCSDRWAGLFLVSGGRVALIRPLPLAAGDETTREKEAGRLLLTVRQTVLAAGKHQLLAPDGTLFLAGMANWVAPLHQQCVQDWGDQYSVMHYSASRQPLIKIDPQVTDTVGEEQLDGPLAAALGGGGRDWEIDFLREGTSLLAALQKHSRLLAVVAVPLCIVVLAAAVYLGRDYHRMKVRHNELKQQVESIFRQTVPEVQRIVNPVHQLRVINNDLAKTSRPGGEGRNHTVIELLAELSRRIAPSLPVTITRLVADDEVVRIKGTTKDFNTVDGVQRELEKSPMFVTVEISSANQSSKDGEIRFELKVETGGR